MYCTPWGRDELEKLCRYITRPAVAEERLNLRPSGDIVLKLKTQYSDGTSHLLFSGLEYVEKLAALVPPPQDSSDKILRASGLARENQVLFRAEKSAVPVLAISAGAEFEDQKKPRKKIA